jgi:2'-5' RNA ligase
MDEYLKGGDESGRYFVALPVSSVLTDQFEKLLHTRQGNEFKGRWSYPDDLHITLRFLGYVSAQLDEIKEALERVKRPPFHIEVRGLNAFYNKKETILYGDVCSTRKLTTLCTDITDLLVPLGFDFGTRHYVPHVTFARIKAGHKIDKYLKNNGKNINSSWQADKFHLMRSASETGNNKRYEIISSYDLTF